MQLLDQKLNQLPYTNITQTLRFMRQPYKQKRPSRGVSIKKCSENMQQNYRKTPMPKCDFDKIGLQLY